MRVCYSCDQGVDFRYFGGMCLVRAVFLLQEINKKGVRVEFCLFSQRIFVFRGRKYFKKLISFIFRQIMYFFNFKGVILVLDCLVLDFLKIML